MRVVSLVPCVTETLLAWGVEPVAVTRFCERPGTPTVGGTKYPDIDAIVALAHCAFVPIWRRPRMTINADTYGASILSRIGWATAFGDSVERYPTIGLDEVREAAPDTVIVPTEPYSFEERHCRELETELACPAILIDGKDLFWWGVRTPSAIERLARALS